MARLTEEMLRRWDEDPDAGYEANSPFTLWWDDVIDRSVVGSEDDAYTRCVRGLRGALYETMYSLYEVAHAPSALSDVIKGLEMLRGCDVRLVPDDPNTLDLQDISQMLYLLIYQMDVFIGADAAGQARADWADAFANWYHMRCEYVKTAVALSSKSADEIREYVEYEDDYYFDSLDELTWVINMLEWYKLDDPTRDIGIDLDAWRRQLVEFEEKLRPRLTHLRKAGLAYPDMWAPRRFWWRASSKK
ncbi:hypothetical protein GCM10027414_04850 [Humibacter ginsengiterrae]